MINTPFTRRNMLLTGAAFLASSGPLVVGGVQAASAARVRIVIVGGGFGGAAAARAARAVLPKADVILLTDQPKFWMCPGSNSVIAGYTKLSSIEVGYDNLKADGIDVLLDPVQGIAHNSHRKCNRYPGINHGSIHLHDDRG